MKTSKGTKDIDFNRIRDLLQSDDFEKLRSILQTSKDSTSLVNRKDETGNTLVHFAVSFGLSLRLTHFASTDTQQTL
jgi:hypothetical protein